ncbi:MAG TPA: twin-arginine translocation signal domain-containing protein [Pedobacter sp.]|uniref:twin-arginine translocation signal domain-containing protein n=1 Tax=Pedobacter sp. TaxID=1411316 RepID=UPI002CE8C6C2|nr:twin-arginine translocation signal domain-containing protein [Pedobacter sp.]HMI03414.1 twin-arginine translocation signal domain-containing protein [Pedobacter sp.]
MKEKKNQNEIAGNSRRDFLGKAGLAVSAALLPVSLVRAEEAPALGLEAPDEKKEPVRWEVNLKQTGWNTYAPRYVYAPKWTWESIKGAAGYVIQFADADDSNAKTIRLKSPEYDMAKEWTGLSFGPVDIIAWAVDAEDKPLCSAWRRRFYKSPGFDGVAQEPADWKGSIDRAMTYLLAPARDKIEPFEGDMPRSCWSCCEESISGQRRLMAFPALHHPSFVFAYLDYAIQFPAGKLAPAALKQAKQYGDWLLANRLPADWRCSLFPFSTIEQGRTEGYIEGKNITLFRSARVGEGMVALYRQFKDQKYLDYARHIADVFVDLQTGNGSWPYRVDPRNGKTVEEYTSNAVTPARLLGILEEIQPNPKYAASREKAAAWVMENPVRTGRWQGMYEDIGAKIPYQNLEHWDTNEMIRYLVHYGGADSVKTAERLNHYIEDQFVLWQPTDKCVSNRCPTPTVMEQYTCYVPMEVHTGMWIMSLLALHRATGHKDYLAKAINAGNSIVLAQQQTGAYSTWSSDVRFGRPLLTIDWPGCNAVAVSALLQLENYVKSLPASRNAKQPL